VAMSRNNMVAQYVVQHGIDDIRLLVKMVFV
jgi:hypothetical protein